MSVMTDRLQALLDPRQASPSLPTAQQVERAVLVAEQVMAKLAPADLEDAVVARLAGKSAIQAIGPLLATAQALRQHPEVTAATSVTPEEAEHAAHLMMAASSLHQAFADLHEGIESAVLLLSGAIDEQVVATLTAVSALPVHSPAGAMARCLFGEPARLRLALSTHSDPTSEAHHAPPKPDKPHPPRPLAAPPPRVELGLLLRVLGPGGGDLRGAVQLGASVVDGWTQALAATCAGLPLHQLSPAQKGPLRRKESATPSVVVALISAGLRDRPPGLCPDAPDPAALLAQHQLRAQLIGQRTRMARGVRLALTLRGLAGVHGWLQLREVYQRLQALLTDPRTPPVQRERWLCAFGSLLAYKEAQIQAALDGRDAARDERERAAEVAQRSDDELLVADAASALQKERPLSDDALAEAADAYARLKQPSRRSRR